MSERKTEELLLNAEHCFLLVQQLLKSVCGSAVVLHHFL